MIVFCQSEMIHCRFPCVRGERGIHKADVWNSDNSKHKSSLGLICIQRKFANQKSQFQQFSGWLELKCSLVTELKPGMHRAFIRLFVCKCTPKDVFFCFA